MLSHGSPHPYIKIIVIALTLLNLIQRYQARLLPRRKAI